MFYTHKFGLGCIATQIEALHKYMLLCHHHRLQEVVFLNKTDDAIDD